MFASEVGSIERNGVYWVGSLMGGKFNGWEVRWKKISWINTYKKYKIYSKYRLYTKYPKVMVMLQNVFISLINHTQMSM